MGVMMGRVKVLPKRGEFSLVVLSLMLSLVFYGSGFRFLGMFFMIFGFTFVFFSFERVIFAGTYKVRVKKKGAVFEVEIFQDKRRVWRGNVSDYAEFGDVAFDVRGGRVAVVYMGKEVGLLP
ncbi:hypothetical protein [Thermococcus camini]|uniref:Uncharacterized protein n=1 Tax=Thermococcus camini TaxID=2016373 RepID=A0A7G2D6L0_9EURY|nr:hypothetical protein [Thermococcus camini]CAD5243534.1 conserved protein of unknown function [Thermococcus camini]